MLKTSPLYLFMLVIGIALSGWAVPALRAADLTSAASGPWHVGGTWSGGVVPGAADTVTILSVHTVTVDEASAAYTVSNLIVNGMLTHAANNDAETYRIKLTILGDLGQWRSDQGRRRWGDSSCRG